MRVGYEFVRSVIRFTYPYSNIFSTFVSGFCAFCEFCSASFVIAAKNKNDERHSNFFAIGRMVGANARDLPWRFGRATPWGVLVSEVMSQQTQMSV